MESLEIAYYENIKFGRIKRFDKEHYIPIENIIDSKIITFPWAPTSISSLPSSQKPSSVLKSSATHQNYSQSLKQSKGTTAAPHTTWSSLLKPTGDQNNTTGTNSLPSQTNLKKKKSAISAPPSPSVALSPSPSDPEEPWRRVDTSEIYHIQPRGLVNNGNMCFMNSILQPLLHSGCFYRFLKELGKRQGNVFNSKASKFKLLSAMIDFMNEFTDVETNETTKAEKKGPSFSCEYVYDALRLSSSLTVLKGRQEDAQEFLGFLLDGLHEELLLSVDLPVDGADWIRIGPTQKTPPKGPERVSQITRIFGGIWRSTVKSAGKSSITSEPFSSIALDIADNSITTLEHALLSITNPEILEGYHPTNHSTKQIHFEGSPPPVLVISLKRFVYEGGGTVKVKKFVACPVILEIGGEMIRGGGTSVTGKTYQLYAVVNHHGKFAQGGHYTCDILTRNISNNREWTRFDDTNVSSVEESIVIGEQSDREPYILFYREIIP